MTGYNRTSELDDLILAILKRNYHGLKAMEIKALLDKDSNVQLGPHQITSRLIRLKNKGFISGKKLTPKTITWFYGNYKEGDLMLDGDYNKRQLKELVYDYLQKLSYPVLTADIANYISKITGIKYTSHTILGVLIKLKNEGRIKSIRKFFGKSNRAVIYWVKK
nr:MAG TPA: hypothetical protein [Caudoviricetes sp.]